MLQKLFFWLIIMMSFLLMSSSNSWLVSWLSLELISYFMFPLILSNNTKNFSTKMIMWKFFFMQAISSALFILSFTMSSMTFYYSMELMSEMILMIGMFIKLGIFPFHAWVFEISENLSWTNMILFTTIPKFAPLLVLWNSHMMLSNKLIVMSSTVVWFCLSCSYEFSMRRFLIYSSMMNVIWMSLICTLNITTLLMYMTCYMIIMLCLMHSINKSNKMDFSSVSMMGENSMNARSMTIINVMSLCGFPPLLGFMIKLMVLLDFYNANMMMMCIPLMTCSTYMVSIYMNISFMSMLNKTPMTKSMLKSSRHNSIVTTLSTMVQTIPMFVYIL